MRVFVLLLLLLPSCAVVLETTDVNACGIVRKVSPSGGLAGDSAYLLEVNPKDKIFVRYYSSSPYKVGDTICIESKSRLLTKI